MSILSSSAPARVALHRHVVMVHMTPLGARLRSTLKGLGYPLRAVSAIVEYVGVNGTAEGSPADADDVQVINDLVVEHTADVEYEDASQWPAVYGAAPDEAPTTTPDPWADAPTTPARAVASWAEPFATDYEPSYAERIWATTGGAVNLFDAELDRRADEVRALELMTIGLDPSTLTLPALCGGSPTPDERPIKLRHDANAKARARHLRGVAGIDDADHMVATGSV